MIRLAICLLGFLAAFSIPAQAWVREVNTTLRVPQVPGSLGYHLTPMFPFQSDAPVGLVTPPGETNRLFIVEQPGRIIVVTNLAEPTATVFLDVSATTVYSGEQGLLGLAFHPRYAENGRLFIFRTQRTGPTPDVKVLHDVLSEFRVSGTDPNRADPTSELALFRQYDEAPNHNGGDLHFGSDGYLYVAVGDEGGANNQYGNGERIDRELFAGILRLDVDRKPGSLPPSQNPEVAVAFFNYTTNYAIPADNPFVGATNFLGRRVDPAKVRTEFWAVGLRNPWRFSFDAVTGEMWIGDVGQNAWESVTISRTGANHGWAYREGQVQGPGYRTAPPDFLTNPAYHYVAPLYVYSHGAGPLQGNSITGGLVYRGTRLSGLYGNYLFADYVSGNVWSLRRGEDASPQVTRLTVTQGISAFGTDPRNGDVLVANHSGGRVLRLDFDETFTGEPLPPTLAETGAFSDLTTLTPNPGIVPYSINLSFWSDGAMKQRWFSVPDTHFFLTFRTNDSWGAPPGSVWVKHFEIELTNGVPESVRRLETRFLVRNTNGIHGFTYRWDSATNATLVPETGADETITRVLDGVPITQTWRYPGRAECLACHTPQAGHSLSFKTAQLLRDYDYPTGRTNQLAALIQAGYFANPPVTIQTFATVTSPTNELASVEWRARSWLAVNCGPCHRPGGSGLGLFDTRLETPTDLAGLINGLLNDQREDPANRVLVPGDRLHSQIWQRISIRGPGQMPPLASRIVDPDGVAIVQRWIDQLSQPPPDEPATLAAEMVNDGLHLWVRQPANRAVTLEVTPTLVPELWSVIETAETGPYFPAEPRELSIKVPPTAGPQFFRARTQSP